MLFLNNGFNSKPLSYLRNNKFKPSTLKPTSLIDVSMTFLNLGIRIP